MKKILALVLALCMMLTALPVFAETAESESEFSLDEMFEDVLNEDGSTEGKTFKLLQLFSALKEKLAGKGEAFSVVVSSLADKLQSKADDGGIISTLLSLLKGKHTSSDTDRSPDDDGSGLGDLLGGLLGGSDTEGKAEWTEEDEAEYQSMVAEMNEQSKNETGDRVANKKEAGSIEEFYGEWTCSRFSFDGTDYPMLDSGVGIFIGENTCYNTENGEKAADNTYADTVEMTLENNVLKILSDGKWEAFVLTEDGELVSLGTALLFYYVRADQAPQPASSAETPSEEVPAASESASSSEDDKSLSGLLSGLMESSGEKSSGDVNGLTDLVDGLLGGSGKSGSIDLSGLGSLMGGSDKNGSSDQGGLESLLGGLLGDLLGGTDEDGWSEEDTEDLQTTLDRISERALNETGEGFENKKNVENIEEFYGNWICTKMILLGETYDMTGDGDPFGMIISENKCCYFENADDELPEDFQMILENGILKVFDNGTWNAFVLTEDGELIETGENLHMVYVRGE